MNRINFRIEERLLNGLEIGAVALALLLIPRRRRIDLWELSAAQRPAYAFEILDCAFRAICYEAKRFLFPALAFDGGSLSLGDKRKLFNRVTNSIRRCLVLFLFAYLLYIRVAVVTFFQTDPERALFF